MDPEFCSVLTEPAFETLSQIATQSSSVGQIEKLFKSHFEGVTRIVVNEEDNGFRKVYFLRNDQHLLVAWGVKNELFYDSAKLEDVENQIYAFIGGLLSSI